MNVVLSMAMSVNGIVAGDDGSEDFLSEAHWSAFLGQAKKSGCVLWGKKTYEAVKGWGGSYLDDLKGTRVVVVTSGAAVLEEGFERAGSPPEALDILIRAGFTRAVLSGGSTLNTAFAKLGLIDEVVLTIEPVMVGKGVPLFAPDVFNLKLSMTGLKKRGDIVEMRYSVRRS